MLDHPVTQKALATVVAAGLVATGGVAWNTREMTSGHTYEIRALQQNQAALLEDYKEMSRRLYGEVSAVGKDVAEIKTGVAVLKERTERIDVEHPRKPGA
jgi:ubiquinone biosynthesis protein UbiJ